MPKHQKRAQKPKRKPIIEQWLEETEKDIKKLTYEIKDFIENPTNCDKQQQREEKLQ